MAVSILRQNGTIALFAACVLVAAPGCGEGSPTDESAARSGDVPAQSGAEAARRSEPEVTVPDGAPPKRLVVEDLIEGSGRKARKGDEVTINYVIRGWDGSLFSNSWNYSSDPRFLLGEKINPAGFYYSIVGMRVGGRRKGLIPAPLYYYPGQTPGRLERRDNLVFVVDLLGSQSGKTR